MKLSISIAAENLPTKNSKFPDTYAVITIIDSQDGSKVIGQTEIVTNTSSPDYIKRIILDEYIDGEEMNLVVTLYDHKSDNEKNEMTAIPFQVMDILKADDSIVTKPLKDGSKGTISMRLDVVVDDDTNNHGILKFQLRCINLINTDGYGVFKKSDPFFELHRYRYQTKRHINIGDAVYRSNVINNNLSPIWPSGDIPVNALVSVSSSSDNADTTQELYDIPFRIVIYDSDDKRDRVYIGEVSKLSIHDLINHINETALFDIEKMDLERSFPILNDDKKEVGKLLVLSAEIINKDE